MKGNLEEIKTKVKEVIADVLKDTGDFLDFDKSFLELGINSVLAVELVEAVNHKFGIELGIEVVFDYQGIQELAEHILNLYGKGHQLRDFTDVPIAAEQSFIADKDIENKEEAVTINCVSVLKEQSSDIAITGISGKFAGSETIEEFWNNLKAGNGCIEEINRKGWEKSRYYDPNPDRKNKSISKWGGFLKNIDRFDASFFNISPLEAERMDPQQRLFLEEAFKAFEDGGYSIEELSGKNVGVFVGGRTSDYKEKTLLKEEINSQTFLGNDMSILAARISYFLNFKGPSLAIDTACSSSLVAIHLACESIRRGASEIALAGGVFVLSSPEFYIMASKAQMLSPDGTCKTFDNTANGIVIGEGVGALVLKRLEAAIEDGDHIYGVIKGSAINQDGKTKGITAPSMISQKNLLYEAYKNASIHPETVSYIEAHGTGTKLGDPIEVKALTEAFRMFTDKTHFCTIGSHKPNFGHTIMSAGIAGVFKILMAMQHRKIPPTISIKEVNEHINLTESPFFVNTELQEWQSTDGGPLRAGVSSFGFSGTNCHIIIEEPPVQKHVVNTQNRPYYFLPFSAKTKSALKQKIADMGKWLAKEAENYLIDEISYTLLIGRSHFPMSCVFIARNIDELKRKITEVVECGRAEGYFENVGNYSLKIEPILKELKVFGERLIEELKETGNLSHEVYKEKLLVLADLYLKEYDLTWKNLFRKGMYRRIPLPTYPFIGESYWAPEMEIYHNWDDNRTTVIHPLIHQNTSTFSEQRFSSTFTGQEFFLADHVVKEQHVLPGVAYLEMARVAVDLATGALKEDQTGVRLKNVIWARPLVVNEQPIQIHIKLFPEESGEITYEIYSHSAGDIAESVIHSQGRAALVAISGVPPIDLEELRAQCNQTTLSSAQCYEAFSKIGIDYGPGHKGIETVFTGSGQVLAKLSMPSSVADTQDRYMLHPSLLDAALQTSICLMMNTNDKISSGSKVPYKLSLPFALQELDILDKCTATMWALVRYSDRNNTSDKLQKLDIDLCDDQGKICIQLKGFSSRVLEGEVGSVRTAAAFGLLRFYPIWKEQAITREGVTAPYDRHVVMLCEPDNVTVKSIETHMNGVRCLVLESEQKGIVERLQTYATQVFEEVQSIFKDKYTSKTLVQIVISTQEEQQLFSGLLGLLKTSQLENPKLIGQLVELDVWEETERIVEKLKENSQSPLDSQIRYQDGQRYVIGWSEVDASQDTVKIPWKDRGIYLITGGAGGLGLIFAKEIVHKVEAATLILTGRSPLGKDKQTKLKELQDSGARIVYKQVDVTLRKAVVDLVQSIREEFGILNGIIHSAGMIHDNFILKKNKEEFQEVLAPKVSGVVNLDQASKDLPLEFFICFSSIAGVIGNVGQADYSIANAFMDAYAKYRNTLVASKQRQGQTLAINWPLWKDGGMHVDMQTEKMMRQSMGMIALESLNGIRALYQSFATGKDQVMVMEGNVVQLRHTIRSDSISQTIEESQEKITVSDDIVKQQTLNFVRQIIANAIKLSPEAIKSDTSFEKYGIDSILQMNLIRELEKVTGELPKTLLFEYTNMQELVDYLMKNCADKLISLITLNRAGVSREKVSIPLVSPDFEPRKSRFMRMLGTDQSSAKQELEDIAIIGISGRYPLANTLEEFWGNLKAGRNCITETPNNRWNTSLPRALSGNEWQQSDRKYFGGFLEHIDRFDHYLFEVAQAQVLELSPELRLFLEIVWETFEDAGYTKFALQELQTRYQKGVGVFVGTMYNQYFWSIPSLEQAVVSSNVTDWQIANRTSHFFNLTGPSIAVNSACSSSLTAIHLACESLKQKSCSMAIAGGINLTLDPSKYDLLQRERILGSGSQSKSFGSGDGYIPGEGVGAVLLKPLSMAIQDHDRIDAVIKSSFINHSGGRQRYTAPDPKQQTQLILNSIQRSGIDPATINYVESAANGSELGDPIEVIALNNAFGQYTDQKQYCALGSVKSNIGHLEAASGISQLSKVLLQMKHQTLVPSINANPRNPNLHLEHTSFYLQEESKPWIQFTDPKTGENLPRRSMINSFGAGGAYANIIVEERETLIQAADKDYSQEFLIVFSAKTAGSLIKYLVKMQVFLQKNSSINIGDVARSLHKVNHDLEHRAAIIASSIPEILEKLDPLQEARKTLPDLGVYISLDPKSNLDSLDPSSLQQILEKKDLRHLAQHWVAGATIDLGQLYKDLETPGVALPKYAFDHDIAHNFDQDKYIMNSEAIQVNDVLYQNLVERIAKGELSRDQFKHLVMM